MRQLRHMGISVLVSFLLVASLCLTTYAYDGTSPVSADIIYVADLSGSANNTDNEGFLRDALKLGVDLAPENSRIAIVSVNHEVISETPLTDVSSKDGRDILKQYIAQLRNNGDTNFSAGLLRAVEILKSSYAYQKRIIFLGDFKEGGYNAGLRGGEDEAVNAIESLSAVAKGTGISIDMVLWSNAPDTSKTASSILSIPQNTGGRLFEISAPSRTPGCVEEIYLQNFSYQYSVVNVRGNSGQTLNIPMPTNNVRRARVFVSALSPVAAFGASYSGAGLDGEQNRSYSMIELKNPSIDGINITLSPGEDGNANVYTIVEYNPFELSVSLESNSFLASKEDLEETQHSVIRTEIVDAKTQRPLLSPPYSDAVYKFEIISPSGVSSGTYTPDDSTIYSFFPALAEEFGTYQITAELTADGITFGPLTSTVEVPDIRQPVPIEEPTNWPLIISIFVGALLILSAIIIAFKRFKKERELHGAVEMASDYKFHGKLHVCAVMVAGGNEEIRPYDFLLYQLNKEKRVTLKEILASGRASHHFPEADDVLFLVGPEESIIVRNNANITIRAMGKEYGPRSKVQLFYGQKIYIIFERDENELELYYRKTKDEAQPVNFNVSMLNDHSYI